jgi:hypothetical protein
MNLVFANHSEENVIYPLTVQEIADAQEHDPHIQQFKCDEKFTTQLVLTFCAET